MKIKHNTKLIPIKNPNFEIKNNIDELINLIKDIPIVTFKNEKEDIIGLVDRESNFYYDENFIYGNIIYISEEYINYEFLNYTCYIKDINEAITEIKKFDCIEFKNGE